MQLVNKFLSRLGFSLVGIEKQPWFHPKTIDSQVGRFSIRAPSINQIPALYARHPDYAGHLGRVTTLLRCKYPGIAAIDIGANVGDTACIIKSAEDIPLICIEGDDLTFGFLTQNICQFQNTTAHKLFLGEKTEMLSVNLEKRGWNATLIPNKGACTQEVKIVSLDDFLATQSNTSAIKLLKIDTEGFDCSIIRGAKGYIQDVHPVINFEYNRDNMAALGEKGLDTLAMLSTLGYSQVAFHDAAGRFFSMALLSDDEFIRDIHDYADGRNGEIYYFDITLFHGCDQDVAHSFGIGERARRAG